MVNIDLWRFFSEWSDCIAVEIPQFLSQNNCMYFNRVPNKYTTQQSQNGYDESLFKYIVATW